MADEQLNEAAGNEAQSAPTEPTTPAAPQAPALELPEPFPIEGCKQISVIFNFTNLGFVPVGLKRIADETPTQAEARKNLDATMHGEQLVRLERGVLVSIKDLQWTAYEEGFVVVDAWWQLRINQRKKPHENGYRYAMVRFDLRSASEIANLGEGDEAIDEADRDALHQTCQNVAWQQLSVYRNPVIEGGMARREAGWTLSINPVGREPLTGPDGLPLMRYPNGQKGKKAGETAVPIKANVCIGFGAGSLVVCEERN